LDTAADVLGELGSFANKLPNFTVRSSQIEMAQAIEKAIEKGDSLVAESGTGTGKTFAYLVPILMSQKKTLISTGTKHLQEQLFYRDIPTVLDALGVNAKVSLLKGRSNYLCLERLQQIKGSPRKLDIKQLVEMEAVSNWLSRTKLGDIAELTEVPEDSRLWPLVTSTVDNCLGQKCAYFDDCFVNQARKKSLSSDVVVINHHLYFADKSLKDDGFGALLPEVNTIVFDEAHQIPDIASHFLGNSVSSWQVTELVNDTRLAELKEKSLVADLTTNADKLDRLVADYRLGMGLSERRASWDELTSEVTNFSKNMQHLASKLDELAQLLERAAVAGEALTRCYERALELAQSLKQIIHTSNDTETLDEAVRWVEVNKRTFRIHETPLHIGNELKQFFGDDKQTRVFTSATISINHDFSHYQQLVGLPSDTPVATWDSPFDYYNQAVLYVPEGLPQPKDDGFIQALFEHILPVIQASEGRAFILFTSFKVMQEFDVLLEGHDFNVLMQGQSNKTDLINDFMEKPRSVLLGTMSFWEGVDVPGEKLSCVIIDKLPFESPFEPVLQARLKAMQDAGDNPFMSYQVPRAVITLRQGAGRLIRSQQDKGVLMICDARLRRTHYGKVFLNSLPPMRRTSDQYKICRFLEHC